MHELSLIESALALVERSVTEHHATRVERIVLRVGALAGVDVDSLRFAFAAAAPRTVAADAVLEIEELAARVHCAGCERDFAGDGSFVFQCPQCGALSADIRQGRELELSRIEMT